MVGAILVIDRIEADTQVCLYLSVSIIHVQVDHWKTFCGILVEKF